MKLAFVFALCVALTELPAAGEEIAAANLKIPKDFRLELLYTVPRGREGSWVTMCVDPRGRLIVGDQNGKLYRYTPPPIGDEAEARPVPIDLDIGGAHGLLYAFDSLYVMVNEGRRPHGLYRLRDTNGDDRFDEVKLLRKLEASGEHGAHSMVVSPDGKSLYVVVGNQSKLTAVDSSRVPMTWGEDTLVKRIPTGFMDDSLAPQGWIARTDPEGKEWELIAVGFRNQFDHAFNRHGELFTYDADMEWDIGAPWYRPTRVYHVISGAEFGFRNGSGKWPEYAIDSFGTAVDIGPGSPTGVAFGYGAKFPTKYQEAFYIADWSFGKLRAVHLTPSGASYTGEVEDFVSGQPLAVTDLVINPKDGAMYFAVGGRNTQSALYRLSYIGKESTAESKSDDRFAENRALRRKLESFHGRQDPKAVETVWQYLGDSDRAIRYAARIALEWQDASQWRERAIAENDPRKAIAAIVALARASGRDDYHRKASDPKPDAALQGEMLAALDRIDWSKLETGDRLDLIRTYELTLIRLGRPDDATCERLAAKFDALFPAQTKEFNIHLANMLVYLQAPSAAAKTMALLGSALTQEEQIEYVLALRALKTGWTMPLRETYFRWFNTKGASYRGGNTFAGSLRTIKAEAVKTLTDDERAALKAVLEAAPERLSPEQMLAGRKLVKEWSMSELAPLVESGLAGGRDFERGRKLYSDVACAACHRFDQDGGSVGPDLTAVAGRFNVRDLLESIVEPSKVISDQYGAIVIETKDGRVVTGRVGNLSGEQLQVIENMLDPGRFTRVRRSDIESIEPSKVSMMPQGLLNTLTGEEIQDLFAYLMARETGITRCFALDPRGSRLRATRGSTMKRREFLVTAGAGVAASRFARGADEARRPSASGKVLFKPGHQGHSSDSDLRMLAGLGVPEICAELPSSKFDEKWSVESLVQLRKHVESFGIRLVMLPLPLSSYEISRVEFRNIMLAKDPERNQEIEHVQQIIRNCADAGIPAVKYNMSMLGVLRGRHARGRGGSRYSNFVWKEVKRDGPLTIAGELDEKTVWDRITYFLERVVPVAEKCGVRMACHPHDPGLPPGEKHRGLPRVLGNVDGLKKFVEIAPSKYHGLNFCQGTIGEMLVNPRAEIYDVIRYFGTRGKIFNVHFRNIQGGYLDFRESFIDDGHMNMIEALRVYREVGFDGMIMPDHVPDLPEDNGDRAAFAFAFGYIKAAIQQVTDEVA